MRILVTGGRGQLGSAVCRELDRRGCTYDAPTHQEMDITDFLSVQGRLELFQPNAVIHCAAWTSVDGAEEQPEAAMRVNATGTYNLAAICGKIGAKMLYVSTDYVFPGHGNQFYKPNDETGPLNVYGASKLLGERAVQKLEKDYLIVRTSWVFGLGEQNFVATMLRLGKTRSRIEVVNDQVGSPTYATDLAPVLCELIAGSCSGIYHVTNEGICSWAELAEEVFRQSGQSVEVVPTPSVQYGAKARRPLNSRLDKQTLDACSVGRLPHWKDAVGRYVKLAKARIL